MLAAILTDARPVAVSERELTIAFPAGAAFLKGKAEQDDYRRIAAEALRTVTGHRLTPRYELREPDPEDRQAATSDNGPVLSGEELVKRFLEEFDAEEIFDEDPDHEKANS
jgi:DNA polymerase-3 subunit gamma/tau